MSLMIATPMYGGQCSHNYFHSCLEMQQSAVEGNLYLEWVTTQNESLVQRARNTMAAQFLASTCRKLLFIDADIGFSAHDVAKMWNQDADIIAATVPMKHEGWWNTWLLDKMIAHDPDAGLTEVDFTGTAMLMIDRKVFENLKTNVNLPTYNEPRVDGHRAWDFFGCRVQDDEFLSEDYAFCARAREAGHPIIVDPSIRVTHAGSKVYGD